MNDAAEQPPAARGADTVSYVVVDKIAWVRFNRPEKRNCMSPQLNRQMLRVLDGLGVPCRCRRAGVDRRG